MRVPFGSSVASVSTPDEPSDQKADQKEDQRCNERSHKSSHDDPPIEPQPAQPVLLWLWLMRR
jgi:hypothetical protein